VLLLTLKGFAADEVVDKEDEVEIKIKESRKGDQMAILKSYQSLYQYFTTTAYFSGTSKTETPFVEFIVRYGQERNWHKLIEISLMYGHLTPMDVLWVIRENAELTTLTKDQATRLFITMILNPLCNAKRKYLMTSLMTKLSITIKDSNNYNKRDRFSVLAMVLEYSQNNENYLTLFRIIADALASEKIDLYAAALIQKGNKRESINLASWIHSKVERDLSAYVDAAHYILKQRAKNLSLDCQNDLKSLVKLLINRGYLTPNDYIFYRARFEIKS